MSTIFTWTINNLERKTADGIVYAVHYTVNATDDIYSAGSYGSVNLQAPAEGDSVIPYDDLTAEIVTGWVKESLGGNDKISEIQDLLQAQINEQRTPTKATGLPWVIK